MKKLIFLTLLGSAFLFSACSIVRERPTERPVAVRDVPFSTRGGEDEDSLSLRKRLLVLPFLNKSSANRSEVTEEARDNFIGQLSGMNAAVLVKPDDLKVSLEDYKDEKGYRLEELAKIAAKSGVAAIAEGQLLEVKIKRKADNVGVFRQVSSTIEAKVQVKVIASRNGKELMSRIYTQRIEDGNYRVAERVDQDRFYQENPEIIQAVINDAFKALVPDSLNALDKLAWEGRVALVQGDRVYLNVGRLSGVQLGDILKVSEDGEEVFDPETGGPIGKIAGRMKGTLEIVSYFGQDGAIAIVHSGAGFKENDKVELY